ncbi:hypothetical protein [Ruegeria arenilitoris]|uniref:hypothetical protein n=1 Tax=Ruegeria arenilitoris TaxID=1173585 RepID=UPI00147DEAA4|nr:hypothetical protein [Ruegeria arenilitoris]
MIDVVGDLISIVGGLEKTVFSSVLVVLAIYTIKFEHADKLAIDMALAGYPRAKLDELGWVSLTELIGTQSNTNDKTNRRLVHRRILFWGLPKLNDLNAPVKSAARRYRLNTVVAISTGTLAASHFSVWLPALFLLIGLAFFLRTPKWPLPKGLNA